MWMTVVMSEISKQELYNVIYFNSEENFPHPFDGVIAWLVGSSGNCRELERLSKDELTKDDFTAWCEWKCDDWNGEQLDAMEKFVSICIIKYRFNNSCLYNIYTCSKCNLTPLFMDDDPDCFQCGEQSCMILKQVPYAEYRKHL